MSPPRRPQGNWLRLLRPLPWLVGIAAAAELGFGREPPDHDPAEAKVGLVTALAKQRNLSASPSDVYWVDSASPSSWPRRRRRAWVLASTPSANDDVYLIHVVQTREGHVVEVEQVYNLTDTFAVGERNLAADGTLASWAVGDEQRFYHVRTADLRTGRPLPPERFDWSARLRWQLAWLQQTGQTKGVTTREFKLVPAPRSLSLAVSDGDVAITADTHHVVIPNTGPPSTGGRFVQESPQAPTPQPGNWLTWAVDRARGTSWVGDESMQWLKAVAYRAKDWAERQLHPDATARDDAEVEFDTRVSGVSSRAEVRGNDGRGTLPGGQPNLAESAWPPANIPPLLEPAWDGEGVWQSLAEDPFTRAPEGLDTSFVTTFIRSDDERPFARTLIVLWDPSLVELHMMSGTEEPKSATGATGPGLIPRDPELLQRLVAAFNGGFQGTHGNYGMMVDTALYVPPRPYAATVGRLHDGTTAFGTWPEAQQAIPEELHSFRQNLTPLVASGQLNPYGRMWWGGVPQGWQDDTQTVRSGLCLTHDGFVAYFYGTKIDANHLGKSMLAARCDYGLHLDMNQGHTGLEFYRVDVDAALPPLGLPLQGMWQAEGPLDELPGFRFRGRRLFRGMQLMNFPRYIQRQARDFFYLTLRRSLPGPNIEAPGATEAEGHWRTKHLPQHGMPPVMAQTSLRPLAERSEARLHLLALDPSRFEPRAERPPTRWLASLAAPSAGAEAVWWQAGSLRLGATPVGPLEDDAVLLFRGSAAPTSEARAAVAIGKSGELLYAELATGWVAGGTTSTAELLSRGLLLAGADRVVYLDAPSGWVVGGHDLSLHPASVPHRGIHLARTDRPGFRKIFKGTPVVERSVWRPLQNKL